MEIEYVLYFRASLMQHRACESSVLYEAVFLLYSALWGYCYLLPVLMSANIYVDLFFGYYK